MSERIVFADGTVFHCPEQPKAPVHPYADRSREWKRLTICAELALVKEKFVDGAVYFHEWDSLTLDAQGKERLETIRQELSAYSIAGDLVDTRDGNITVYMGKPTELEKTQEILASADALAAAAAEVVAGTRKKDILVDQVEAYNAKKEKHGKGQDKKKKPKP